MILGVDEVGRGAWAGPLVVGACVLNDSNIEGLTDSKALSKKQRELFAEKITNSSAIIGLGWVSNKEIDDIGLGQSLRLATRRAIEKVQLECRKKGVKFDEIIIDGTVNFLEGTPLEKYVSTIKKADLLISSVSAAAICAKVARDDFMKELGDKAEFSVYGFSKNVGYGTAGHRAALDEFGVSDMHRRSFKPIANSRVHSSLAVSSAELSEGASSNNETTKQIGDFAEDKVAAFLTKNGHEIISRNWRTRWCEIDIISNKDNVLYFTEVKYRKNTNFGGGVAALSKNKIKQMRFAADFFVYKNNIVDPEMRLLGVVVEGEDFEIKDSIEI